MLVNEIILYYDARSKKHQKEIVRFTMHIFSVYLLDTLKRIVYVQLYCYPTTFPHSPRHIRDTYIVGRAFCSLLTEVGITCHQRSCHTCFHLAIIFKSVVANSLYVSFSGQSLGEKFR
jgi:hypothetical protein